MSKFINERWYTGPKDAPAYVQMSSIEGPQGGFRITRSDKADHEFANLISAAPDMYALLRVIFVNHDCGEVIDMEIKEVIAKADGKGE